jgi:beta-glucosidase/6-phospho-beta-glucosidase/beta-galactosidase
VPVYTQSGKYSEQLSGTERAAVIAVKDWEPVGFVTVKSFERRIGASGRAGSKITYEMLMNEARKLNAHDVINVGIDVTEEPEEELEQGMKVMTYTYTATALAIRYTKSVGVDAEVKQKVKEMDAVVPNGQ